MTYDGPNNTTYGESFAQMRDKIASMTNWSTVYDSTSGGTTVSGGDSFGFSLPNGEYVLWSFDGNGQINAEYGPDLNTNDGTWNDKYPQSFQMYPGREDDYGSMAYSDQVRWWFEYVDGKGYVGFVSREEGDGKDNAMAFGHAELTRLWDYTTAQVREGKYVYLAVGHYRDDYGSRSEVNYTAEGGNSGGTYTAKGQVNADGNNDNYPMVETSLVGSNKYEDALIGEHDMWILDNSGSRSAHLDTVTDGGGDLYQIFTENLPTPIGIRME